MSDLLNITAPQATLVAALLAGLFGGVIGNVVKARLDERSGNRRLRFERQLARQESVIKAQVQLLEDLTAAIWRWRYRVVRLSYDGAHNESDVPLPFLETYRAERWNDLNALRTLASRARRLISDDAYLAVIELYDCAVDIDKELEAAASEPDPIRRPIAFSDINRQIVGDMTRKIDDLLLTISSEFKLVA